MVAQYPQASWIPAAPGNYRTPRPPRSSNDIDLVVIHITDGGARLAEQTARWFANPNQHNLRGEEIHVSAHYVVGRQGEVVQCVRHEDIAHHAGRANPRSVGIEHVVPRSEGGLTDEQYGASVRLVSWLGDQLRIPLDSQHIKGHAQADHRTTHRTCPDRAFDWTEFWMRVASQTEETFDEMIASLAR